MTIHTWDEKGMFDKRQAQLWSLVPSSVDPKDLDDLVRYMQLNNTSFLVEVMLYGVHIVLFALCCYVLTARQKRVQWFILGCAFAMFAISTADIAYTIRCSTADLFDLVRPMDFAEVADRVRPKPAFYVTNNFVADILLFHRCYVIWGRPKLVLVIALVCLTADTMWGWLMVGWHKPGLFKMLQPMYYWSVFAINVCVTAASVGRIYWVTVLASTQVGRGTKKIYRTIISAFVESAAVYTLCILVYLIWTKVRPDDVRSVIMLGVISRISAIMPTLMIVQVAFSRESGPFNRPQRDAETGIDGNRLENSVVLDTVISRDAPMDSLGSMPLGWIDSLDHTDPDPHNHDQRRTSDTGSDIKLDILVVEEKR
ncbi:hypothetical protein FA13DRAFT_1733360 [Coprinellus micaceus]|uniref:Uncharacterized protein n=1 Tax=Coprinellus micaceus TaxID=71717 RepID=A0A4Y7TAC6_COPMI|nr:hypothetical protein FA13DRAFT_1733360 [Coprinellus micaceus]